MAQTIFTDPVVSSAPTLTGGSVGNGTLTVDRLTHFTITQTYTAICTAVAPFTVFQIVGSLDGAVGQAQVAVQFNDADLKIFLTINQGSTAFEIGDQFDLGVTQGTDLKQSNIDDYDELPQKNFSEGTVGTDTGDDNLRFEATALKAASVLQDLEFTAKSTGEAGNKTLVRYYDSGIALAASKVIQDLTYTADTPGSAGNSITVEYEEFDAAVAASGSLGEVGYDAQTPGAAGNSITVSYTTGGTAGSEVVSLVGTDISVQIESGVSTAQQVKTAVNAHGGASALVVAFNTGTGLEAQTAPQGPSSLTGGSDAVGDAGNEVVSVIATAITVKLESGVSTATQVKAAVDAFGAAAALVDTTISGTGSNPQSAPFGPSSLEDGQDAAGGPGSEIVTVEGTRILVGFQDGVNTAQNIKDAIDGTPAAALLVDVAIDGTAGNAQDAPDETWLSGGVGSDTYEFNINELSSPADFFRGSGSLLVEKLTLQHDLIARRAAGFLGIVTLNDIDADDNLSGPSITNAQQTINNVIQNDKLAITTLDGSPVSWSSGSLSFTSDLRILMLDTGRVNIISESESPIAIADGEAVSVTLNRAVDAILSPSVGSSIATGENTLRIASRLGSQLVLWDNSTLLDGQSARFGGGVDLTTQVLTILESTGVISHSTATLGQLSWNAALKIRPLGSDQEVSVNADTIDLADDEVAYVDIDSPIVDATRSVQVASRDTAITGSSTKFWLFHRTGSVIVCRNGFSLAQGEEWSFGQPHSSVTKWRAFSKTYSDLAAAALDNNITLTSLGAREVISGALIRHTQDFNGGSITEYYVSVGITGALDKYGGPFDVFQAVGANESQNVIGLESVSASTDIKLRAVSVGDNLDQATQGTVEIYLLIGKLPA